MDELERGIRMGKVELQGQQPGPEWNARWVRGILGSRSCLIWLPWRLKMSHDTITVITSTRSPVPTERGVTSINPDRLFHGITDRLETCRRWFNCEILCTSLIHTDVITCTVQFGLIYWRQQKSVHRHRKLWRQQSHSGCLWKTFEGGCRRCRWTHVQVSGNIGTRQESRWAVWSAHTLMDD